MPSAGQSIIQIADILYPSSNRSDKILAILQKLNHRTDWSCITDTYTPIKYIATEYLSRWVNATDE